MANISYEPRNLNITYNKSGSGSVTSRISLPITWLREMGVDENNREVIIEFKNNSIVISKNK